MAWTLPRTWSPGETVTASLMNAHLRDNLNVLKTSIDNDGLLVDARLDLASVATIGLHRAAPGTGSSTSGETSLTGDITIPANTLVTNGDAIRVVMLLHTAANANNKGLNFYYGGTSYFSTGAFTGGGGRLNIKVVVEIVRTGASAQQVATLLSYGPVPTSGQTTLQDNQAANKANGSAQVLKLTADAAVANNDIVIDAVYVERITA